MAAVPVAVIVAITSSVAGPMSAPQRRFVPFGERARSSALPDGVLDVINANKRQNANWRGVPMWKSPFDTCILLELLREVRPRTIIELGALSGGSALFLADQSSALGMDDCHVYSLDITLDYIDDAALAAQDAGALTFMQADANALHEVLTPAFLDGLEHPLVVLEDAHVNVEGVLRFFDPILQAGDYVVVEDTVDADKMDAVAAFLNAQPAGMYAVDTRYCDFFGENVCWCPNSYLIRMRDSAPPRLDLS